MGCLTLSYHPEHYEPPLKVVRDEDEFPIECASTYSYGYNGVERDDEAKGAGNSYITMFRQYDPRLGRWLSIDPEVGSFVDLSPYSSMANSPIIIIDPNGDVIRGSIAGLFNYFKYSIGLKIKMIRATIRLAKAAKDGDIAKVGAIGTYISNLSQQTQALQTMKSKDVVFYFRKHPTPSSMHPD